MSPTQNSATDLDVIRVAAPLEAAFVDLGRQFDHLALEWSAAVKAEREEEIDMLFGKIDVVVNKLIATPAHTLLGLRVKARVVQWCNGGNLEDDDPVHVGTDARVERSITRDLVRLLHGQPIDRDHAARLLGNDLLSRAEGVLAAATVEVKAIDGVER